MIRCPNCLNKEMVGAIFCSECGAPLLPSEDAPTNRIYTSPTYPKEPSFDKPPDSTSLDREKVLSGLPKDTTVLLNMINTSDILPLIGRTELTIGRVSGDQPLIPDIDLSPYKALEAGVSRIHASIKIDENQVTITDLGSSNGTRINDRKIPSNVPQQVNHGDIVTLGRLKFQILFRERI